MRQRPIAILTFHRALNDGSILQAMCLSTLLRLNFGSNAVSIVDYFPKPTDRFFATDFLRSMRAHFRQRNDAREKFLRQHSRLTLPAPLMTPGTLRCLLTQTGARHLVMGSDTIWDATNHETRKSSFNPYFSDMSSLGMSLSHSYFAASSDPDFGAGLSEAQRTTLSQGLQTASFIGYRDEDTRKFVEAVQPAAISQYMPDPTLMCWPDFLTPRTGSPTTTGTGKRIGVQIGAPAMSAKVIQELSSSGYTCIDLYKNDFFQAQSHEGADAFIRTIMARQQLDSLVTDRFHGAIIFFQTNRFRNCPVIMLRHANKWTHGKSKVDDMFRRIDAPENVMSVGHELTDADFERMKEALNGGVVKTSNQLYEGAAALADRAENALTAFLTAVEASLR